MLQPWAMNRADSSCAAECDTVGAKMIAGAEVVHGQVSPAVCGDPLRAETLRGTRTKRPEEGRAGNGNRGSFRPIENLPCRSVCLRENP